MTSEQLVTLIIGVIGGGGIGAILTAVFTVWINRNKPKIDEADVISKLHETTVSQLNQMQNDAERIRGERDAALKTAHEWEKQFDIETERHESTRAFNRIIEARAIEAAQSAREYHERAIQAEATVAAQRIEIDGLQHRVTDETTRGAILGAELVRQQTGPLRAIKTNDKPAG